ncbi:MAG: DEAD/DEAH box helicase [Desulfurococcaceae archaeon]
MDFNKIAVCLRDLGYQKLTEIQKKSLVEVVKNNRSLIIVAPTGSGKTEAAVFPVMLKISLNKSKPIAAIYITPLRALNRDIERRLNQIAKCFGLNVGVRHGDTPASIRKSIAHSPPHILVTTPETFNYILVNDEMRVHLNNLEYVIIDEYRDLLESKRGLLLFTSLYLVEKILGKKLVKIALSATLNDEEKAKSLISFNANDHVKVLKDPSIRKLDVKVVYPNCGKPLCNDINSIVGDDELSARIEDIVEKTKQNKYILVFTNTRSLAESLSALLGKLVNELQLNISLDVHHGSLSRAHREKVERDFRDRKLNMLVSTSSLELGIDIGHVEYVIQYMSPRQAIRLIQRVGRSRHKLGDVSKGEVITTSNLLHLLESCVITWRAINGLLEREIIIPKPLDVLAYAISLYVYMHPNGVLVDELYDVITAHPLFRNLARSEFNEVLDYLAYTRVIKINDKTVQSTRKTKLYLYKTSMIPSTRDVQVIEAGSNKKVGTLDEEYVVVNLNPGDIIVLAGRPWRIISYDENEQKLYVESAGILKEEIIIPHWEGENIPVEYEVAQQVGEVVKHIKEQSKLPPHLENLLEKSIDPDRLKSASDLGDVENITVDYIQGFDIVIINIYGGTKVNALVRDILKYVLKSTYPYLKINVHSTPYSIIIQFQKTSILEPGRNPVDKIHEVLNKLHEYANGEVIERIAKDSTQYLWRIYQVAQRFGAISPEATQVNRRLLEAFTDTIIGKEALKEVLIRDYDIESFMKLTEKIAINKIKVTLRKYDKIQDHHLILLGYIEIPVLKEIPPLDTNSFLERLLNRSISILCLKCGYFKENKVGEVIKMNKYSCPRCGLATLTLIKGDATEEIELVKKLRKGEKLSVEEQKMHKDLVERAILLYRYGDKAVLALSTPGVGTRDAVKIINKILSGEDLIKVLYEYELHFLKIKKYLKDKKKDL